MKKIDILLKSYVIEAIDKIFNISVEDVEIQATRDDFEGDLTLVVFPLLKLLKTNPKDLATNIGEYLLSNENLFASYNVTMVEYSSPNTNKPLHLGHIRNNLLGYSVAEILKASGKNVLKTQIINDRGIHICKSMIAWKKYGNGETPQSSSVKGDKLVGNYYVLFDKEYRSQVSRLIDEGNSEDYSKNNAPILIEAKEMLVKWEAGEKEIVDLWKLMNNWVYKGFNQTYKDLGVDFDNYYYESDTYLLGKEFINEGLKNDVFYNFEYAFSKTNVQTDVLGLLTMWNQSGTYMFIPLHPMRARENPV